jgi:hypothetical protein
MAIQFTSSKVPKEESVNDILDKAMANLQKFSAPILKITQAHPSKTTTTDVNDPAKGLALEHELTKDIPSFGETLLGGVSGAVSGFLSGGNFSTDENNPGGTALGKGIGAAVGGFLGSASYSGGREAGKVGQQALGTIAGVSQVYKASEQQKMASDAVGSATQRMSELNNPGNDPQVAASNSAKREQITSQLATDLVKAGMAPDKAITTAQNISVINAPNSKDAQDPGLQAQRAIAQYNASDKTQSDKDKLKGTLNGIIVGQSIKLGKMPANASALLFGAGGGGSSGGGGNSLTVEPVDQNGNVTGPPIAVGAGSGGGAARAPSPSSGGSDSSAFDYNGGDQQGIVDGVDYGDSGDTGVDTGDGSGDQQFSNASDAKSAQVSKAAMSNIDKLSQMIDSGAALPEGAIDGKQWDINKKGIGVSGGLTGGATGGAAAGAAIGSIVPGVGTAIGGGIGAVVGGVGGALTGQALGKGTSLGIPDQEKHDFTQFTTLAAALSQQLSTALGARMTPEMHAMVDTIASPYSSNEERSTALATIKEVLAENASMIGSTRAPGKAKKAKQPGLFFFN